MNKKLSILGLGSAMVLSALAAVAADLPKFNLSDGVIDREAREPASFAPVVKKVAPCVVTIFSTHIEKAQARSPMEDQMLRRFFGDNGGGGEGRQRPHFHESKGLGSGVILTTDGYIITNNHVVDGADNVKVVLADGSQAEYPAKVVGTDPLSDIAVLKIEAKDLKAITLSDSDKLEVGDVTLAVGNPFGVGQTVTKGIVSAVGRGGFDAAAYEDFIQTDAAINPGNSGGALVDIQGRLIGINQSIISRTGGNQGVGFAVPINQAKSIVEQLITDGAVKHGYLGVMIQSVTPDLAKEFKLANLQGALVGDVQPNTPAATAGLKEGDVIKDINGKSVADARHLRLSIAQSRPQTKVSLKLIRDGKDQVITATLGTLPQEAANATDNPDADDAMKSSALDGVDISDIDSQARHQFGIPGIVHGAVVTQVEPGSSAQEAGLQPGDVIVNVNRRPVGSADAVAELVQNSTGSRILLRVWSKGNGGAIRYVLIEAAKKK